MPTPSPARMGRSIVALHRNALALSLARWPRLHAVGIEYAVAVENGIGMRIAMQQVINKGLVVAIDLLAGVAVLDTSLCVPLLG